MAVFSQIATLIGGMFFSFFGAMAPNSLLAPAVVLVFMFIMTIAIGFYSKMSLDGYLVAIGLEIATVGGTFNTVTSNLALSAMFFIVGAILVTIAFMRLIRH